MYHRQERYKRKEKLKKLTTAALFSLILLAEAGEFFVPHESPIDTHPREKTHHEEKPQEELHLEIPEHVPEDHKEVSKKLEKLRETKLVQKNPPHQRLFLDRETEEIYSENIL